MDSKVVDAALRGTLWPRLKGAGFARRSGRTAWRDRSSGIQCVSVGSFNSYRAEIMGSTTYSFGVNLGVYFPAIAARSTTGRFVRDRTSPKEYECHLRKFMAKGLAQPNSPTRRLFGLAEGARTLGAWSDRPDVWLVVADWSNVSETVADATDRVVEDGLPWLERVVDPREAIRCLLEEPDVFGDRGVILEMYGGAIASPGRWNAIGALAASTGDRELLHRSIEEMSSQAFWEKYPDPLNALRADLVALDEGRTIET